MAHKLHRLSARTVETVKKIGRHADGGGLYLSISANGGRRWVFLYRRANKLTELGLGSARTVSLSQARTLAADARKALSEGRDPKAARTPAEGRTFGECADKLIEAMRPGWRNQKHADQWTMTLGEAYCRTLRPKPVDQIETADVLDVLKPLWNKRPETASRLRGRIERVLDAAKAEGLRTGENPARWRGHLDQLLPRRQRLARGHHAAMPYADVPAFMEALRARPAISARALEFLILTATRTSETLLATWSEFDLDEAMWTIPAQRTKSGRAHRVPLSKRALAILTLMRDAQQNEYVFPGQRRGRPFSDDALRNLMRRMKVKGAAPHGFRSAFRDWSADCTNFPNEVCEAALAHVVESQTERAYRRGDLFEKRRTLMDAWAGFCAASGGGKVLPFKR